MTFTGLFGHALAPDCASVGCAEKIRADDRKYLRAFMYGLHQQEPQAAIDSRPYRFDIMDVMLREAEASFLVNA